MRLEELLGPMSAQLASQEGFMSTMRQSYGDILSTDGVSFPSSEVKEAKRLYSAQAQIDRGVDALEADGSPIDLSDFDREAAGNILQAHRQELINDERLTSLTSLGLLSKAGSALVARAVEAEGEHTAAPRAFRELMQDYKRFVQICIATEEWGQPWSELVAYGFEGPDASPPLPQSAVFDALGYLGRGWLGELREQHFKHISAYRFNIFQNLTMSDIYAEADETQLGLAAAIGVFYRHSPQGCSDLLDAFVTQGTLQAEIDWQHEVVDASQRAAQLLPGVAPPSAS